MSELLKLTLGVATKYVQTIKITPYFLLPPATHSTQAYTEQGATG